MIKFNRIWSMPSIDTFDIEPIGELIKRYLLASKISIDPFARNKRWATYTNDLNPNTAAEYHMPAIDFLRMLLDRRVIADLIIFDPLYTIEQVKQCYESIGLQFMMNDAQQAGVWTTEKDLCYELLDVTGVFIHCGYHSNGMGKQRDMVIDELLLVPHGRNHYDTIITVEHKLGHQDALL